MALTFSDRIEKTLLQKESKNEERLDSSDIKRVNFTKRQDPLFSFSQDRFLSSSIFDNSLPWEMQFGLNALNPKPYPDDATLNTVAAMISEGKCICGGKFTLLKATLSPSDESSDEVEQEMVYSCKRCSLRMEVTLGREFRFPIKEEKQK